MVVQVILERILCLFCSPCLCTSLNTNNLPIIYHVVCFLFRSFEPVLRQSQYQKTTHSCTLLAGQESGGLSSHRCQYFVVIDFKEGIY